MSKALVCGSFDPVTNGHMDIIGRTAKLFDCVVVGVFTNSEKKYTFSADDRAEMIREACAENGLNNVTVDTCTGMVAHYVRDNGIDVIVKGVRSTIDYEYERTIDYANKMAFKGAETLLLLSDPNLGQISSTVVREFMKHGEDISSMVPKSVMRRVNNN